MPRVCNRQVYRDNHGISNVKDYFRVTVTVPFLDHVVNEISERFGDAPASVVKGFSIVPDFVMNHSENWKIDFQEFAAVYERDMVSITIAISSSPSHHYHYHYHGHRITITIPSSSPTLYHIMEQVVA